MNGVVLIAILAVIGGLVAIAGDRIGMRVGRKRLTLFGLRPRYTSVVITFLTGIAVVALTVTVLSLLSENVRIALFKIQELRSDLAETNDVLRVTKQELELKMDEAEQLTDMVDSIGKQYEALKADYGVISGELSNANAEKVRTYIELQGLKTGLEEIQRKLASTEEQLSRASLEILESGQLLKSQQSEISGLSGERQVLEQEIEGLKQTRLQLLEEAAELEKQVNNLLQTSLLLIESKQTSMTRQVIFSADQIVLGAVIDCSQPVENVHVQINDFLIKVNSIAGGRGAGEVAGRQDGSVLNFDEDNVLNAFQKVYSSSGKVIMRAVSPVNSWPGEPLWISLHTLPDELIFFKGQVVASKQVDGRSGADSLQTEILGLIEEVNAIALAKGMVSDEQGRIGTFIKALEFTEAIIGAMEAGRVVNVEISADEDIWRSDSAPTMGLHVVY